MTRAPALGELAQLLRLRSLRAAAAERECARCAREVDEAEAALARRDARIASWCMQRDALARFIVGEGAHRLPRFAGSTAARRAHLAEQHERDAYARQDDVRTLEQARARLVAAQGRRAREQAREDETRRMLREAGNALALHRDTQDAVEVAPLARVGARS